MLVGNMLSDGGDKLLGREDLVDKAMINSTSSMPRTIPRASYWYNRAEVSYPLEKMRDAGCEIKETVSSMAPGVLSRISYPASRISYPVSRISYHDKLVTNFRRAVLVQRGESPYPI